MKKVFLTLQKHYYFAPKGKIFKVIQNLQATQVIPTESWNRFCSNINVHHKTLSG